MVLHITFEKSVKTSYLHFTWKDLCEQGKKDLFFLRLTFYSFCLSMVGSLSIYALVKDSYEAQSWNLVENYFKGLDCTFCWNVGLVPLEKSIYK